MVRITHREYIGDVISSSSANTFVNTIYRVNPGLSGTFPWLSTIAGNFLHYEFENIGFEFNSTAAASITNGTNMQLGIVGCRFEHDPVRTQDVALIQIQNGHLAHKNCISRHFHHAINPNPHGGGRLVVRTGAQPTGTDLRMYDLGYMQLYTAALPGTSQNIGQLWVHYTVHLERPNYIQGQLGYTIASAHYYLGAVTQAAPLTGATAVTNNALDLTITAAGLVTFPSSISTGLYLVSWSAYGGAGTYVGTAPTPLTNCSILTLFSTVAASDSNQVPCPTQAGAATTRVSQMFVISVNAPGTTSAAFTLVVTTMSSTMTTGDLLVTQWNGLMNN